MQNTKNNSYLLNTRVFASIVVIALSCNFTFAKDSDKTPTEKKSNVRTFPYEGMPTMDNVKFDVFYTKVKKQAATGNFQLDLITVGCLEAHLSCLQCAKILSVITASSDQLTALEVMAPCILDPENEDSIYNVFTFERDKEKAKNIFRDKNVLWLNF